MFIWTKSRKAMQGYSRNREDFRDLIFNKYKMKELTYIYWPDCAKCHQLRPHVEKRCSENWYNFVAMQYADSWFEIASIPTAILEWDKTEVLDFDGIVNLLSSKK